MDPPRSRKADIDDVLADASIARLFETPGSSSVKSFMARNPTIYTDVVDAYDDAHQRLVRAGIVTDYMDKSELHEWAGLLDY